MRTAKQLFVASPAFADFQKLLASPSFEPACLAALLTLVETLPASAADPSRAWDAYLQILGARRVLEILSTLHTPDEAPHAPPRPTLHYDRPTKG
jgi:hypothetical protein